MSIDHFLLCPRGCGEFEPRSLAVQIPDPDAVPRGLVHHAFLVSHACMAPLIAFGGHRVAHLVRQLLVPGHLADAEILFRVQMARVAQQNPVKTALIEKFISS